jgi:hypothetical protein
MTIDERPTGSEGAKRFRSPPYPQITIGKALERVRELYEKANRHPASAKVLADAWGFQPTSGVVWTTASAMLQFGLLSSEGSSFTRKFRLTDAAQRILLDPDAQSEKRISALQRAALSPKIHSELWQKFQTADRVSDAFLKSYLTLDRQEEGQAPYSDSSADEVIRVYRDAIRVAGLASSGNIAGVDAAKELPQTQIDNEAIEDMATLASSIQPAQSQSRQVSAPAARTSTPSRQAELADEERELTSGLLSREATFRLIVSGRIGVKEIDILIRKLQLDKEILAEPEVAEGTNK